MCVWRGQHAAAMARGPGSWGTAARGFCGGTGCCKGNVADIHTAHMQRSLKLVLTAHVRRQRSYVVFNAL